MIHPDSRLVEVSEAVGLGVVATAPIRRGTLVWVQDRFDVVVPLHEYGQLGDAQRAILDRYAHLDADQNRVMCWDAGRYVNHACAPTMRGVGSRMMLAVRDLEPGDPLTCDYAECNLDEPLTCLCGSPSCRGAITREDLSTFAPAWDEEVRSLCIAARAVPQPLWAHLVAPTEARAFIWGGRPVPSFARLFEPSEPDAQAIESA